jgi:hypothetical protein
LAQPKARSNDKCDDDHKILEFAHCGDGMNAPTAPAHQSATCPDDGHGAINDLKALSSEVLFERNDSAGHPVCGEPTARQRPCPKEKQAMFTTQTRRSFNDLSQDQSDQGQLDSDTSDPGFALFP